MSPRWLILTTAAVLPFLCGCERDAGAAPPVAQRTTTDPPYAIGPVPGTARRAPKPENPLADDPEASVYGRRLFNQFNCAGCHGTHAGGGMGPSLRDRAWIYGGEDADIYHSIAAGRAHGMPAWGSMLPPQTIWQLVAYIRSLGTDKEPQPPR